MELDSERKAIETLGNIIDRMRAKITDRMCMTLAIASAIALFLSLIVFNMPAIVVSGLTALSAVAMSPESDRQYHE